ncbi:MAG: DUF1385 domain-containing protein [Clostridiales bacterium]|nr:DUF1385 domain-containing protein [Clostridiales bacterium]
MKKEQKACKYTSIGGQALIEGIMMRGPIKSAMAVRNPAGEIVLEEWDTETSNRPKFLKLPFIRGIFNFIDSMKTGYRCLMRSAEIAMPEEAEAERTEKEKKKDSILMSGAMMIGSVLGVALSIALFIWLPAQLFSWISGAVPALDNRVIRSVFEGLFRILLFVGYMSLMCLMKDIRRLFQYHGAEHKTIFCYEAGLPLTVENIRPQRRFHPRCGTSFMILMLLVGIIISMFITVTNPLLRTLIKLALLPVSVGIGYELIKFCGKHDNIITKIVSAPGVWLQHITVHEPDDSMIECAIKAMNVAIPKDGEAPEKDNSES